MPPWHCTADTRVCGIRSQHTFEKKTRQTFAWMAETIQQGINAIRYVVERSMAQLKVWRILSTPSRLPQSTTIRAINVIRKIMFYQPPAEPRFPSSWISFYHCFLWIKAIPACLVIIPYNSPQQGRRMWNPYDKASWNGLGVMLYWIWMMSERDKSASIKRVRYFQTLSENTMSAVVLIPT